MNAPTRRVFLGFAQGAVAAAAVGAIGVRFIATAEAMSVAAIAGGGGGDRPRSLCGRERTALRFRSDQLCFTAAIGCEARRAGSR